MAPITETLNRKNNSWQNLHVARKPANICHACITHTDVWVVTMINYVDMLGERSAKQIWSVYNADT